MSWKENCEMVYRVNTELQGKIHHFFSSHGQEHYEYSYRYFWLTAAAWMTAGSAITIYLSMQLWGIDASKVLVSHVILWAQPTHFYYLLLFVHYAKRWHSTYTSENSLLTYVTTIMSICRKKWTKILKNLSLETTELRLNRMSYLMSVPSLQVSCSCLKNSEESPFQLLHPWLSVVPAVTSAIALVIYLHYW